MTPSWRKPFGMLVILLLIAAWCAGVLVLSDYIAPLPVLVQTPIYLAAGIAWLWVLPLRRMLAWMETGRWPR